MTDVAARVAEYAGRMLGDLGRLLLLLLTAAIAAITDRRLDDDDRDTLQLVGCFAFAAAVIGGYLTYRLGDWRLGAAAAAAVCVVGYALNNAPPDPRIKVADRIEAALVYKAKVDPEDPRMARGIVRNTEWKADRTDKLLGWSSATVHWTDAFNDGEQRHLDALHRQIESNLGVKIDFDARTSQNYARITRKAADATESDRKIPWPHIATPRLDLWDPKGIPVGIDEKGREVSVRLFQNNVLVGGVMGFGKSVFLQMLAAASVLDPDAGQDFMDGKLIEMRRWSYVARRFVSVTPTGQPDMKGALALLDELQADIQERRLFLDKRSEQKLRKAHGVPLRLTIIDELAEFLNDREHGDEFSAKLKSVIRLSRALGLPVGAGIVRASGRTFDTDARDLFNIRVSFRQMTKDSRKMTLGESFDVEEPNRRGNCWLLDERSDLHKVRAYWLSGKQMHSICTRGIRLRGGNPSVVRPRVDKKYERLLTAVDAEPADPADLDDVNDVDDGPAPQPPRRKPPRPKPTNGSGGRTNRDGQARRAARKTGG